MNKRMLQIFTENRSIFFSNSSKFPGKSTFAGVFVNIKENDYLNIQRKFKVHRSNNLFLDAEQKQYRQVATTPLPLPFTAYPLPLLLPQGRVVIFFSLKYLRLFDGRIILKTVDEG